MAYHAKHKDNFSFYVCVVCSVANIILCKMRGLHNGLAIGRLVADASKALLARRQRDVTEDWNCNLFTEHLAVEVPG
jgi:hypothetical protein